MTDLIEKIAKEIAFAARCRHDVSKDAQEFWDHTGEEAKSVHEQCARAALSVIKDNAGDLVRPLVWTDAQSFRNVAQGQGGIYELGKVAVGEAVMRFIPDGWDDDDELENLGHASTAEECAALKAKAQQHHTARVITLLNLEVE